jgi:hypothetical protein
MKTLLGVGTVALTVLLGGTARASYPCGIYARVYEVKLEGDAASPTRVKVYGDFILVKTSNKLSEPKRGYMYFSVVPGKEDVCRSEWADLKKLASTDRDAANYVAFGSAHAEVVDELANPDSGGNLPNVHEKDRSDLKPVPYPLNHGLTRLRTRNPEESDRPGNPNPVVLLREYRNRNPLPTDRK